MKHTIKTQSWAIWLAAHPKLRQWLWFVALWVGGLFTVSVLTYPLKWLMKH